MFLFPKKKIVKFVGLNFIGNIISTLGTLYLTQIYSSHVFGEYAIFIANISLLSVIATLRLNWAYQNTTLQDDEQQVLTANLTIGTLIPFFVLLILAAINKITLLSSNILLLPFGLWLYSMVNVLDHVGMKKGKSIQLGRIKIVFFTTIITLQILMFRIIGDTKESLIYAYTLSYLIVLIISATLLRDYLILRKFTFKKIFKQHNRFILLSTPTSLFSTLAAELPNYLIKSFFSLELLGNYVVANRILKKPTSVIAESISKALHPIIAKKKNSGRGNLNTIITTIKVLGIISIIPAIGTLIYSEDIIIYLIGEKWKETGKIIIYLLPYFISRFIFIPIRMSFQVYNKQGIDLFLSIMNSLLVFFSFLIGLYFKNFYLGLLLFSISGTTILIIRILITIKTIKANN